MATELLACALPHILGAHAHRPAETTSSEKKYTLQACEELASRDALGSF
jgi:hypothetical protein